MDDIDVEVKEKRQEDQGDQKDRIEMETRSLASSMTLDNGFSRLGTETVECHLPHLVKHENVTDFRHTAFDWAQRYMGGPWARAELKHFRCKGMRGDLTNYWYKCKLILWNGENDGLKILKSEKDYPTKIMLKVYGEIETLQGFSKVEMMTLNIILAQKGDIPKIHAIFPEGRFEEFMKCRHLRSTELRSTEISEHLADYLADYHSKVMPFGKTQGYLENMLDHYHNMALGIEFEEEEKSKLLRKIIRYGIDDELSMLKEICFPCHEPIVFCHNNLSEGNILLAGEKDDRRLQVVGCDLSAYNYRAYDFGNFFAHMQYDFGISKYPYFQRDRSYFPSEETRRDMIIRYVRRLNLPVAQQKLTEDKIYEDSDKFILASHFLWGLWGIVQAEVSELEFGYLEYSLSRFQAYFEHKILNNL